MELLGSFLEVFSHVFFDPIFGERFLMFFEILGLLLGPSWGTLGCKSDHFGTLFSRFPVRIPLWCDFGPSGEALGRVWVHFGRLSGSFWTGFWCRGRLFADTLADPLAGKPSSENLRRSPPT